MWKFKKSKKKMESVMIYAKIIDLSKQYMVYNAVKNTRKFVEKGNKNGKSSRWCRTIKNA